MKRSNMIFLLTMFAAIAMLLYMPNHFQSANISVVQAADTQLTPIKVFVRDGAGNLVAEATVRVQSGSGAEAVDETKTTDAINAIPFNVIAGPISITATKGDKTVNRPARIIKDVNRSILVELK